MRVFARSFPVIAVGGAAAAGIVPLNGALLPGRVVDAAAIADAIGRRR
jgi:hypothetical protein